MRSIAPFMIENDVLLKAYSHCCLAKHMADTYEQQRSVCRYVHSTSRGHEAVQLAIAYLLDAADYVSPYYRDESLLLGLGFEPYELMLQLLAKAGDPFTGGRAYYAHPSSRNTGKPSIIQQSSATGMQVIPTTGIAQGIQYLEQHLPERLRKTSGGALPIVVCSLGDASVTEGEVSEAFQFAVLKRLPILYLVQDNKWGISVSAAESRAMDAYEYAGGFPGLSRVRIDGSDFETSYSALQEVVELIRKERRPFLVQANLPLLGHHTSGVRKEFYRTQEDLALHSLHDPGPKLHQRLIERGVPIEQLLEIDRHAKETVLTAFQLAVDAPEPNPATILDHVFAPTPVQAETGRRQTDSKEKISMVDAALFAIREILQEYPEALLYGQDVGRR
ncbi:thiamine pyrophosphate-dependent dehydrogenase E1 component subunit alpha, partial [Flavihumibacter sp. CACIAM 22H1]|uniref:thiamine pyrophosphate-dependent dehydrogenase E1 component subunit alpha n=1 Tax=Flavihumibacter sp. CACIAM 22H1 TaxID=1812911 RepID=UPI0025BD7817